MTDKFWAIVPIDTQESEKWWDFAENIRFVLVTADQLVEFDHTGHIKGEREYTSKELLENMELKN